MGLDLELRYATLGRRETDHVCTGNSVYRTQALHAVGLFDERLGYGYDNDMSYRLKTAGYQLVFCPDARSVHHWREGLRAYCVQQYGFGYGRLELVAKHPRRIGGDSVSPLSMMLHPIAMAAAVAGAACAGLTTVFGGPTGPLVLGALATVAVLTGERCAAGIRAARRFGDSAGLFFPALHLVRDLAWVAAISVWTARRLTSVESGPSDSMVPRSDRSRSNGALPDGERETPLTPGPVLCIIPAHNEAANLPAVLAEVHACCPHLDVLVVDDGSTDGTAALLDAIGNPWLGFPERLGIGNAMRAGLRYAVRRGYGAAVRLDGDGQHRPDEIARILEPISTDDVDVVLGSRYTRSALQMPATEAGSRSSNAGSFFVRVAQRLLARCLSALAGRTVTDPTSGFYAVGPRALRILASHHPTGYPEPELHLFLSRNRLTVVEVPVRSRPRFGGRTSLMPTRWTAASARVLLALVVEPLRGAVGGHSND